MDRASIRACLSMINEFEKLPEIGPLLALLSVPGRP
jgi:hypothetical protein